MVSNFLVEETAVRDSGESPVFDCGTPPDLNLVLTLGITHALEQESLEIEIYGSRDGLDWSEKPLVSFPPKCYCGIYQMSLPGSGARFLKAVWRVKRWARGDGRPFFRFYIFGQTERQKAMAGAA